MQHYITLGAMNITLHAPVRPPQAPASTTVAYSNTPKPWNATPISSTEQRAVVAHSQTPEQRPPQAPSHTTPTGFASSQLPQGSASPAQT